MSETHLKRIFPRLKIFKGSKIFVSKNVILTLNVIVEKFFKHIFHTSIYRSKVIKLEVYLWEMCQKVSNKNVIIQSENITFFHFIITFMITFLNYIELIFIQKCNRYF